MSRHPYQSPRRAQAAKATRAAVLETAARLFVEHGFTNTTLGEIAAQAEVSLATVKSVFGTKRELLEAAVRNSLLTDPDAESLSASDRWQAVLAEPQPERMLERFAASCAELHARSAALIEAVRYGGAADPALAELAQRGSQNRHEDLSALITVLEDRSALKDGLEAASATDILWALSSPNSYRDLVVRRGWSEEQWASFTAETLISALLETRR